jgi:hypothetical protein
MPFDFTVFDGHTVILYLPSTPDGKEFDQAIIFKNQKVAELFKVLFARLREQGQKTSSTGLVADTSPSRPIRGPEQTDGP